ncbi:sensor domain-containing phosphodiesterase [Pseudoduganella rivuli]|nr:sensor domain-containing phosphodiesterase [Pseudoduganella rivuli]
MDTCSMPSACSQDEATEQCRLTELSRYAMTQDHSDPSLDLITNLAIQFMGADIGGISIVYQSQIWLPSRVGLAPLHVPRAGSLCTWAVASGGDWFEVDDALHDVRFKDNALVAHEPHYRHYAAATLKGARGYILGTFWMMWRAPGLCADDKKLLLQGLAKMVMETLEMRYCNDVTGMSNRKVFLHHLQLGLERSEQPHVMVGYVDLISFRQFNDMFGRDAGNEVLRVAGERLTAWAGPSNLVAHLGGDKFAFALFGEHQVQSDYLERLTNDLSAPFTLARGGTQAMHARIGVEHHDLPYRGAAATLLDAADTAASSISSAHMRTTVKEFGAELLAKSRLLYELQGALAGDIRHGALVAHYQPQVNYAEGRLIGMEALVRWQHPARGLVSPGSFIAVAESSDKIYQVDLQVLEHVCRDMRAWLDAGLPDLPVSLNFSRRSLLHPDVIGDLQRLLTLYGIPGRLLEFEVTESLLVETPELLSPRVAEFRAMGIRIAIDDFGTGYSNLDAINSFSFDRLKVDRQFVHGVASNKRVAGLFRLIQGIAEVFDVELVCEGLELEEDRAWLAERGSHCVQGWYFSPARTPRDIAAILAAVKARGADAPPLSLDELRALFR